MRLKLQVNLVLLAAMPLFLALSYVVLDFVVFASFEELEREKAEVDLQRCVEALDREAHHLALGIHDWASWDATYKYIVDHNKEYEESTFGEDILATTDFSLIYFIDAEGRIVWSDSQEIRVDGREIGLPFPDEPWPKEYLLNMVASDEISTSGIVLLDGGVAMIVAAAQILTTDVTGPPRGTVVMGRVLDEKRLAKLSEQTRVDLKVWPINAERIGGDLDAAMAELSPGEIGVVDAADDDVLDVYTTYTGIDGEKALLLRAHVSKTITAHGARAIRIALILMLLSFVLISLLTKQFLSAMLFTPLEKLTKRLEEINSSDDLSKRIPLNRKDEIGSLADSFNNMMSWLEKDSIEKERLFDEIEIISRQDALTGLPNRRRFESEFDKCWRHAIRKNAPVSLLMVDVDHFKRYNDHYGHVQGDDALRAVGVALKRAMARAYDLTARFGGEEFVVLLPETKAEDAVQLAERVRVSVEKMKIKHEKSEVSPVVTVSIGVATMVPSGGAMQTHLLNAADEALYRAKEQGRNRVHVG